MLSERYRVVGLLGKGGMGEVYRADDLKLGQTVALKFLPKAVSGDEGLLARFHAEVRLARQVSHPYVCRIHDIAEVEGRHFISMEYVDGEDLESLLKRIGRLPVDKAIDIGRQLCAGLHAAHEKGVLHRDLKPANIMLDGRGRVRITDFGLAIAAEDAESLGEIAGTPGYMAPEQLAGKPPSVRSDLYAMGLVLYEVATGKRAFDALTLDELRKKHEQEAPAAPSTLVPGLDPAVERAILRCLERDPRARPASALQVAAALPGGDPLAAALAAGETPSPEMVAAAGPEGAVSTARAATQLAAIVILLALSFALTPWATDLGLSPLPKPPDVLEERARQVARHLGWVDTPVDTGRRFVRDQSYLDFLARTGAAGWARRLRSLWWKPAAFEYRQSPRPLNPANSRGEVRPSDPPLDVTGMVSIVLDPEGNLRRLVAVPPQALPHEAVVPRPPPSETVLAEAGLDPKAFTSAEPLWLPQVPFDEIAGFTGSMPGGGGVTLHAVAAAFRGRPVSFEIIAPWSDASRDAPRPRTVREQVAESTFFFTVLSIFATAAWFARRNVRLGRGDRRGAAQIAGVVFVATLLTSLDVHWALPGVGTFPRLLFLPVVFPAFAWTLYLAFEPYIRRHYPDFLVSWARLVAGRFSDPLVGRDLLGGVLLGCATIFLIFVVSAAPAFVASGGQTPVPFDGAALDGIRGVVANAALRTSNSIGATLTHTAILLFATLLLRRRPLAIGLLWIFRFVLELGTGNAFLEVPLAALIATLVVLTLLRFGLVGLGAMHFVGFLLHGAPLTPDFSAWYSGHGLFIVLVVLALAVWGFWAARGGGPLLKAALDE